MSHLRIPTEEVNYGALSGLTYFEVNFNDAGIASGVKKLSIRATTARPVFVEIISQIVTAFNAETTNVLTVGSDSTANQYLASGDLAEGTPGFATKVGQFLLTANGDLYVKYTQTGAAATTGKARFFVRITPLRASLQL